MGTMTATPVLDFFAKLNDHDPDGALALIPEDAAVDFVPAQIRGKAGIEGRAFLNELVTAFPDLRVEVRRTSLGRDGTVTVAIRMEGTQAGEFLGAINQEKYLDLEQAWMFFTADGAITGIRAYWCQSQLYRRLAIKRFDQVTITG
jgi:ketosteroid isomerase-like protein